MSEDIKIYVADLAAYNNGKLHGVWIDATLEPEDIQAQINEMLSQSPEESAEEWVVHDYEGFESYCVGEYESIESIHEVACFIDDNPTIGAELLF